MMNIDPIYANRIRRGLASIGDCYVSAYVDFTKQSNGSPNPTLDTGHPVDFHVNSTGREPVVFGGRLIVSNQAGAGSGGLADYYQSDLGSPIVRIRCEWTQPAGANDGNGNMTLAAWDGIYDSGGTLVPKSWVHLSIVPGTGATGTAKWFTCDGAGNLLNVKSQTFVNPAADGVTVWRCEAVLDADAGEAFAMLPDGSIMRLTGAELSAFCISVSKPVQSLKNLSSKVMMCEHFCSTGASSAKFPQFKNLSAETDSPAFKLRSDSPLNAMRMAYAIKSQIPPAPVAISHNPSPFMSVATTTSSASVDATNCKVTATVGPSGKLIVTSTAWVEFSASDTYFCRFAGSTTTSSSVAAFRGVSGQKTLVSHTAIFSGLTPGSSFTSTLQHWSSVSGSATCLAGNTGGTYYPPLTIVATPG